VQLVSLGEGLHIPPMHTDAPTIALPMQRPAAQGVPSGGRWPQAPMPSHMPSRPQNASSFLQVAPVRGLLPVAMGEQVPTLSVSLHDWQAPSQALSQQIPSLQAALAHSSSQTQAMPFLRFAPAWHAPGGGGLGPSGIAAAASSCGGVVTVPSWVVRQPAVTRTR
jgi:hypothetical protein